MQRLEEFIGAQLFRRTGRSATLNAAGEAFLPLAEEAMQLTERMRARSGLGPLRGSLRVGTITSLHNGLMARALVAFRQVHPSVTIRLIRKDSHMMGQVEREEFDLAVTARPHLSTSRRIRWIPLLRKPFVLIAPAASSAKDWREAVEAHTFLHYDVSSTTGEMVDDFLARMGVAIRDSLWVDYLDTMISLVAGGLGAAIIPQTPLGHAEGLVKVFTLGVHTFHREIGVVRRAAPPDGGAIADAFIETLKQEAKHEPFSQSLNQEE